MSDKPHPAERSRELHQRALRVMPGGVNSNVRLLAPPVFFQSARGCRLVDVDGNHYIDYLLGQGPNFLGHAPPDVLDAVDDASRRGMVYGAQHSLEVEAAERMLAVIGWAEQVRFGVSGSESVQAALRLARAVTGRTRFIRFEGHYHGWFDNVLVRVEDGAAAPASEGQLVSHLDDSLLLPWNDLTAVEEMLAANDDIAAVIMEPVMLNAGSIEPVAGYLEGVRRACDRHGVLLIFDEVISGFRVAPGGAADRYGVTPDLATYGKAMAGGWPVSALVGPRSMMERFGTGAVNHSGTFNASVMACAATVATLRRLVDDPPHERISAQGRRLMDGLVQLAADHSLDLHVQGLPMAFHAGFGDGPVLDYRSLRRLDAARYNEFTRVLIDHGVWVAGRGIWYLSAAHEEADIDETLERVAAAMKATVS
jgi:glutamate-1-semialdehyde 2,1-aminomutase